MLTSSTEFETIDDEGIRSTTSADLVLLQPYLEISTSVTGSKALTQSEYTERLPEAFSVTDLPIDIIDA